MDFNQLKYFIQIVKSGNITKAAKVLNISQPPLSNSLKNLENQLGVQLIKRNTRSLDLTECGEILFKNGEYILNLIDSTIMELKDITEGSKGTISIGTVSYAGSNSLPNIISNFSKEYPNVKFKILDLNSTEIIKLVRNNILDIGIVRTPCNTSDLDYFALLDSSYVLIGKELNFSKDKSCINIEDLENIPLILNSNIIHILDAYFKSNNISSNIIFESNDIHTIISLAEKGLGYCVIPKDSLFLVDSKNLSYLDINSDELNVGTAIINSKNNHYSTLTAKFLQYLKDFYV